MSTTPSEPLSLEDQCLLHLVCHLEEYPPETLALLPLHLRRRLLLNLPVADVCQLENTAVSAGIDMEGTVWKVLADKRFPLSHLIKLISPVTSHFLLSSFYQLIVDNKRKRAKELLFSARDCLGVSNWEAEGLQNSFAPIGKGDGYFKYPTPHRYVRYFSEECQHIDLMSFLVEKCQWMPLQLTIKERCRSVSELWQGEKATTLVRKFLSRIQELQLQYIHPKQATFILEQVLSNPKPALSRLRLRLDYVATMADVAMFFSPAIDTGDPVYIHPNIPYNGLSSIDFWGLTETQSLHLQSVICHQNALTSVRLDYTSSTPTISLLSVLASLFHQPQFKELTLRLHFRISLTWEHLGILLPQFLSAHSEDNEKVLRLKHMYIEIPDSGTLPEPIHIARSCNRLPRKALILERCSMPPEFYQWLSAYNYTNLLSSLTVEGSSHIHNQTMLMELLPTTTLQHLHFFNFTLEFHPSPEKSFINLFQGPHLKSVHLYNCAIVPDGLLPALTQGLLRQVSVGSLEDLDLEGNDLGTLPESELQAIFGVLFTLPQLSNLRLNLKNNQLKPLHFSVMHNSWRMNAGQSGKRLKVLEVKSYGGIANNFQDHISVLQAVAQSGDFLTEAD